MRSRGASTGGLVYSTEAGRMCPACRQPVAQCVCLTGKAAEAMAGTPGTAIAADGVVRVSRETKGRGGKAVTLVRGLAADPAALGKLCQQLKTACGSGGTVKDGTIEVQGDHCDRLMALLKTQGHAVKRSGG